MGNYYTDSYGNQRYRDKRVYTRRLCVELVDFIDKLFQKKKSNFHRFEDLKLYIYTSKCDWAKEDLEYFAEKAEYKKGWAFHKVKEIEDFISNPSQGVKVERPEQQLDESQYQKLKPFTKLGSGKYKGEFYKDVEAKDPEYAKWYKENAWLDERGLRPQLKENTKKEYSICKVETKNKSYPKNRINDLLVEILGKVKEDKILDIRHPKLFSFLEANGVEYNENIWKELIESGYVVKVGMFTVDLASNYYSKVPAQRYQSCLDSVDFMQKLETLKQKMLESVRYETTL